MIPPVVASDRGRAQTGVVAMQFRGCRTATSYDASERKLLESSTLEGESPVCEAKFGVAVS